MTQRVVSGEEWLAKEKEFPRLRDQLSALRRELPWEALTKEYVFEGADGPSSPLTRSAWAGASNGCPPWGAISISTIACPSRLPSSRRSGRSTTTPGRILGSSSALVGRHDEYHR